MHTDGLKILVENKPWIRRDNQRVIQERVISYHHLRLRARFEYGYEYKIL